MFSLIIPVYRNEGSIAALMETLEKLNREISDGLEAVFVIDGSPDRSLDLLSAALPKTTFRSQLIVLSRNFGVFPAITAGLASARGNLFAIMAADLQEPPELIVKIREELLSGEYDVVVGTRVRRKDPFTTRVLSATFWALYRFFIQREIPRGGVDIFGCTKEFREHLLARTECNVALIGLIFWMGFRRGEVSYSRRAREHGTSAWTFPRKVRYLLDSTFAFSYLPVRLLSAVGILGIMLSLVLGAEVVFAKWSGRVHVSGYSTTVLLILFFGGFNSLGLGLIGEYVWRTFENTKGRPGYIIARHQNFEKGKKANAS